MRKPKIEFHALPTIMIGIGWDKNIGRYKDKRYKEYQLGIIIICFAFTITFFKQIEQ